LVGGIGERPIGRHAGEGPTAGHGIAGIDGEVEQDLVDLARVELDGMQGRRQLELEPLIVGEPAGG